MNLRTRVRHARGAELVELALILPILLIIIAGIVDFGFMFQAFMVVNNAAREGARVRILPGYTNADATARVNNYMSALGTDRHGDDERERDHDPDWWRRCALVQRRSSDRHVPLHLHFARPRAGCKRHN